MFMSRYMPCDVCGASVDRTVLSDHVCSPERLTDYQMFALRGEVARLDAGILLYLSTAPGLFESWLAARQVREQT